MLSLPPKLQAAFDSGNFEPVIYAELTTKTLDQASEAAPVFQATQGSLNIPANKKNVEMDSPDATATGVQVAFLPSLTGLHGNLGYLDGGVISYFQWQSFTLGEDIQQATRLKKISTRLFRFNYRQSGVTNIVAGEWRLKCRVYDTSGGVPTSETGSTFRRRSRLAINPLDIPNPSNGRLPPRPGPWTSFNYTTFNLLATGFLSESTTVVDPVNIGSSVIEQDWTFDIDLIPGRQYAVVLVLEELPNSSFNPIKLFKIGWEAAHQQDGEFSGNRLGGGLSFTAHFATYKTTPQPLLQIQFDLNGAPLDAGHWDIVDDQVVFFNPVTELLEKTAITYHAWAGDSLGAKTIDLGPVQSGDAIPTTALKQFYILEAAYTATANGLRTPNFVTARPSFPFVASGSSKLHGFASHAITLDGKDITPAINKVPSIPTKLNIKNKITRRAGIKLTLIDIGTEVTRIAIEENLLNLPVELRFGHRPTATSKADLALIYTGVIKDYSYKEGSLTFSIESRSINLKKKIPILRGGSFKEIFGTRIARRSFSRMTLVESLHRIINVEAKIQTQYIDKTSFDAVDSYLKGSDDNNLFITNRILTKQIEAEKAVNKILGLIGSSLAEREDGKLSLIQYPVTAPSVGAWDEDIVAADEIQPESISKSLTNLCLVHYDSVDGEPTNVVAVGDIDSMNDWAPGSDEHISDFSIKTGWLGDEGTYHGKTIAVRIGDRLVRILKNGLIEVKFSTSINQYAAQVGDKINLVTPTFLKKGILGTTKDNLTAFVLIEKRPDILNGKIGWLAVEDVQINRAPTAGFTASPTSGLPDLLVTIDVSPSVDPDGTITLYEADFDYDGVNFTVDASRITPGPLAHTYLSSATGYKKIALRVTDDNGAIHLTAKTTDGKDAIIRVLGVPFARISAQVSAPDQPLQILLSSVSAGRTAIIKLTEWDLSYDGVTFIPEVDGETTTLNLPYQLITVALRITDEDGQTALVTQTFAGKAFAPAQVTGFFVDQSSDKIVFNWNVVGDPDRDSYEIRKGATWNSSVLVASEILSNTFMTVAPLKAGVHTYLVKAINTTGRYSITETAITITIIDPRNRNLIATADRKSLGWVGTKTGLVYETAKDQWWIASTDDLVSAETGLVSAQTGILGLRGTRVSGTFEGNPLDLGAVIEGNRLSIDTDSDIIPDPVGTSIITEFSESDDGTVYAPFAQISSGDLGFRYAKELITLKNDDGASNVSLKSDVLSVDVPDVFDSGEDVVISVGGTTVNFKRSFNSTPSIPRPTLNVTIQNMTVPLWYELTAVTTAGFTIKIKQVSNNDDVGGSIDYQAKGF